MQATGGWGRSYYGYGHTEVRTYTEGTLSVDIFNPKRDAPVWHGRKTKYVTQKMRENPGEPAVESTWDGRVRLPRPWTRESSRLSPALDSTR